MNTPESATAVNPPKLSDFRRIALFDEKFGICIPRKPDATCWNSTFDIRLPGTSAIADYMMREMPNPEGLRILNAKRIQEIPEINPFAPSRFRTRGFQLWDAVANIPRPAFGQGKVIAIRDVPAVRFSNAYWRGDKQRALKRVEPTEPYRQTYRWRGPYILDLLEEQQWLLFQAAHMLAHHRGDHADLALDPVDPVALPTARLFQQALGELLIAHLFNLPVDIGRPQDPHPMRPHLPLGLTVCPTTFTTNPILAVPMDGSLPLLPDNTLAVINIAVEVMGPPLLRDQPFLQPPAPRLARCCQPTSVEFVGFELLDVIAHHDIAAPYPDAQQPRLHWGVHHLDLMPPHLLTEYIQLGHAAGIALPEGGTWRYIPAWFDSEEFKELFRTTPPLPCPYCMMWNQRAKEHLARPRCLPATKAGYRNRDDWRTYFTRAREIRDCVERSCDMAEPDSMRRDHRTGHKEKLATLKDGKWLAEAEAKIRDGYAPTGRHLRVYQDAVRRGARPTPTAETAA